MIEENLSRKSSKAFLYNADKQEGADREVLKLRPGIIDSATLKSR